MLENLHNYFVLFHFIDIILPKVISMNSNDFYQLAASQRLLTSWIDIMHITGNNHYILWLMQDTEDLGTTFSA